MSLTTASTSSRPSRSPASTGRGPRERRWTIAEFERLMDCGFLREGGPEFLWDGKILTPMSEYPPHIHAFDALLRRLFLRLDEAEWSVRPGHPLDLREHYQPQPDIVVARGPSAHYLGRQPGPLDVALLVEVADSSYPEDSGEMLREYARAGIAQYWIVNINARRIEVYKDPQLLGEAGAYASSTFYGPDAEVPLVLALAPGQPERAYPAIPVREILRDLPTP